MDDLLNAPFTPDQVQALNAFQLCGQVHPFTCGNRGDGNHRTDGHDVGVLVATVRGWICPYCDWTQDWAHEFMASRPTIAAWRQIAPHLITAALRVAENARELVLKQGYDGECGGDEFEPVMAAIIDFDALYVR